MKLVRLFSVFLLTACGTVPLDIVNDPPEGPEGASCVTDDDCEAALFCERAQCWDEQGRCAVRPTSCADVMELKCGCDGQTYLNSCYRQLAGHTGERGAGPCMMMAKRCGADRPCPAGAFCARLAQGGPDACGRVPPEGQCTVVPERCTGGRVEQFYACGQPPTQCLDFCAAVRREAPTYRIEGSFCP